MLRRPLAATEQAFVLEGLRQTSSQDWCGFPNSTPKMDLVNLKMLADVRLLPSLRTTSWRAQTGSCAGTGSFVFLAKPRVSMADVRQKYGQPQSERRDVSGSETLTYGRFRVMGGKDGQAVLVIFPPLNR
jgi:hypothetical protein